MTDLDTRIATWKASEKERTPGEWYADITLPRGGQTCRSECVCADTGAVVASRGQQRGWERDATHITNSVNLVPELVAEVERLREENRKLRSMEGGVSMEAELSVETSMWLRAPDRFDGCRVRVTFEELGPIGSVPITYDDTPGLEPGEHQAVTEASLRGEALVLTFSVDNGKEASYSLTYTLKEENNE